MENVPMHHALLTIDQIHFLGTLGYDIYQLNIKSKF